MDTQDIQSDQNWKNGARQIKRCQQQKLHFFTNPLSPYQNSSKSVQQIFIKKTDGKSFEIAKIGQQFELKVGKTNMCTKFFPSGTTYYTCRQCCCQTKIGTTMCFCLECWVPEKHIGHYFQQKLSTGSAYCDCGRQTRIKPQSFCQTHSEPGMRRVQISQQQRKEYISYFEQLIMCYLYLRINGSSSQSYQQLEVKLNKKIEQLCVASLYYIRLTTEIMSKRVSIHETERTILEWMICLNQHCEKMLFAMIADDEFKYLVIKALQKLNSQNEETEDIRLVKSQFYQNDSIFFVFAAKGEYIQSQNKRYIQIAQNSEAGLELFSSYLKHQRTKLANNELYLKFLLNTFTQKSYELLMKKKQLSKMILQIFLTESEKVVQIFQEQFLNLIPILAVSLYSIADRDVNKLSQIQSILNKQSENLWKNLNTFLNELLKYSKQFILKSGINKSYWFVVLLRIMIISQDRNRYIDALWQNLNKKDPYLNQDFIQTLSSIYHLTSLISSSFIFFNSFFRKVKNSQLEEERQKWIKSFMYQNRQVSRNDILKMREKGQFKFPHAGQKFKEICSYNQPKDTFQYNSEQKYPNYLLRFTANRNVKDLKNINIKRFKYSDEFDFDGPKYISQTLQAIFSEKSFVMNICQTWNDKLDATLSNQQMKTHWKNYDLGLYYIFTLVYANVLSKKRNQFIGEQIRKIKQNQSEIEKYYQFCVVKSKLEELLQIQSSMMNQGKDEEQEQKIQKIQRIQKREINQQTQIPLGSKVIDMLLKKKVFQMKRIKILEKFKKNTEKFTNSIKISEPDQLNEGEQQCIICHEGGKQDNSLMSIGMMQRNTSVAYSIYGNEDKTQINIKCCFHLIHYSCFLTINKTGFQFNCPLCSKKSNIYIPNIFDKKSIRRSSNLINAIEVTKNKNHDFHFLIEYFVRHLVGNYALNSIILNFCTDKQKSNSRKVDQLILKMAEILANNMTISQKQEFEEEMNRLIESMDSIKKEPIKKVQKFFTRTLVNKLLQKQTIFSLKQLEQIEDMIIPEEFEKIKENLESLIGQKVGGLSQKNENMLQKQRIGIKVNHPPQSFQNFDSYYQKKCQICDKDNTKYVCLLCNNSLCQQCLAGAAHVAEHNSNYFVLIIDSKKISIRQAGGKVNGNHNIYFDAFMTSFEDSFKYNSEQVYELNRSKIQKLITSYLLRN